MQAIPVGRIMAGGVVTGRPEMPLTEVVDLISKADVNTLVVVNAEGEMQGLILRNDLLRYFGKDLTDITAQEVMRLDIPSVAEADTLAQVVRTMLDAQMGFVVVMDAAETHALGVVTSADIVHAMRRSSNP